ncbi:hypothetical protein [Leptospira santarosai]
MKAVKKSYFEAGLKTLKEIGCQLYDAFQNLVVDYQKDQAV